MTTMSVKDPVRTTVQRPAPVTSADLTDRQCGTLMAIGAVVLIAAILALVFSGGPGLVAASTGVADLTAAAFGVLI